MTNKFEHDVATVAKDIGKVVAFPFTKTTEFVELLDTVVKETPEFKAAILQLVKLADVIIADGAKDIAEHGLALPDDLQTLTDIEAFATYFQSTFVPVAEKVYKELKTDIQS